MATDRFDLPLSTASAGSRDAYVAGVDLVLAAEDGALPRFDEALAADPGFALAAIGRARMLQLLGRGAEAREAAASARRLVAGAGARERGHVDAIALAVEGRGADALAAIGAQVRAFPRDAMAIAPALGAFGLFGFSGAVDHHARQRALLDSLAPRWPAEWWFDGFRGWSHVETGDLASGTGLIERSLAAFARNANAAHARAHAFHEAGELDAGQRFLDGWMAGYSRAGLLHGHLSWHRALAAFARGDRDLSRAIYEADIRPGRSSAPPLNAATDPAALLWRWDLAGAPSTAGLWPEALASARGLFPNAGIHFADLHVAMAGAKAGDAARVAALEAAGEKLACGAVAARIARGMAAWAAGDAEAAARELAAALPELDRVGGSHAQREVFEDTLVEAEKRRGRPAAADAMLAARRARRRG